MLRKTHVATGLAATSMFVKSPKDILFVGFFVILGSLIPDLDAPAANIVKRIKYISYISILALIYFYLMDKTILLTVLCIITIFAYITRHRTFTHSILSMIIFSSCIAFINILAAVIFFIGYAVHLICDSLTITGIPLLYPFSKNKYSFYKIKTGSDEDKIIGAISFLLYTFIIFI